MVVGPTEPPVGKVPELEGAFPALVVVPTVVWLLELDGDCVLAVVVVWLFWPGLTVASPIEVLVGIGGSVSVVTVTVVTGSIIVVVICVVVMNVVGPLLNVISEP